MSIQVTPIPRLTVLTVPAFTLGTANAAGSAASAVASDSTLLTFDTTLPDAITFGQSGAVGEAVLPPRRDHSHAMASESSLSTTVTTAIRAAAAASGDVSYTGAGFTPTGVIVISINDSTDDALGIGFIDDEVLESMAVLKAIGGTPAMSIGDSQVVSNYNAGETAGQLAVAKTLDADGVTLTWTKVGAGSIAGLVFYYFR